MSEIVRKLIKPALVIGLLTSFFTLTITILLGEYIIKHTNPQNTYNFARQRGLNIFAEDENIPLTLKKNVDNFLHIGYTLEFDHFVSTNSYGMRNPQISSEKPQDTVRILFLGDSMTFGWGVEDEDTFARIVEKNLNSWAQDSGQNTKFEVLNAGFADGKTLDSYYVFLNETGLKFKPDIILLNFFPYNDILDLTEMNWDRVDEKGLPVKISSKIQTIEDGYIINTYQKNWMYELPILRNSHFAILLMTAIDKGSPNLVKKIKKALDMPQDGPKEFTQDESDQCLSSLSNPTQIKKSCPDEFLSSLEVSKTLISEMENIAEKNSAQLLVTILANPKQAEAVAKQENPSIAIVQAMPQKVFREYLTDQNIRFMDLLPYLSNNNPKDYFFARDGHINESGHMAISKPLSVYFAQKYFPKLKIPQNFLTEKWISP